MVNKILVMGATGKVGHEVVKYLSQQKVKVKAAVHQPKNAAILANLGVEIVPFDLSQPETIQQAFTDVKKLFLLIPSLDTQSEIAMAQHIIDYAKAVGVENIVHLSAMRAENYPTVCNIHVEKFLNEKDIYHIHLRPNFFMQNFNTFYLDHINRRKLINLYDAGTPTSFIDVRDIGAVAAQLLLEKGYPCKTFTLTGSAGLTHAQVAEILSTVSNKKISYTAKSDEDTRLALRDCGWTEEGIEKFLPLFKGIQQGEFSTVQTTDIVNILGRSPISFQQYAADHREFWK